MSGAKILVMDDEVGIRLFLEETLTGDGHEVIAAGSGEQALSLIDSHTFDLALLDLNLPGIGGMDVLLTLREKAPKTVVIILTAHATLETAVEALRQGAHDYLFKPCKTVQLRESIRKGLLKRQQALSQQNVLHQLEQHLSNSLEDLRASLEQSTIEVSPAAPENFPKVELPEPLEDSGRFLQRGELIIDFSRHLITLAGHLLELSPTEFDLLAYLTSEAPRVISPQELVREVQGYESEPWEASETVRQHIRRLRQKIKKATGYTDIVDTRRGVGYTIKV